MKKIVLTLGVAVLAFSGCSSESGVVSDSESRQENVGGLENVGAGESTKISMVEVVFNRALINKDKSICGEIDDSAMKVKCENEVEDKINMEKIVLSKNEADCGKLVVEVNKQLCFAEIGKLKQEENRLNAETEKLTKMTNLQGEIEKSGDFKRCAELDDVNFVSACEVNILSELEISGKDKVACQKASKADTKEQCTELVQVMNQKKSAL